MELNKELEVVFCFFQVCLTKKQKRQRLEIQKSEGQEWP